MTRKSTSAPSKPVSAKRLPLPRAAGSSTPRSSTSQNQAAAAGRVRAARSDALLVKMQGTIEATFGLPEGSVKLVAPPRRGKLDATATIGQLRALWEPKG